ncbi:hypothetical protein [Paenibacillus silvisoli]|nr:hypothetical protein [Paenibacillus silvisoli]
MKKIEDQSKEAQTPSPAAVELDVRTILEQLGIDLSKWPADLPPLQN